MINFQNISRFIYQNSETIDLIGRIQLVYDNLLEAGVAKECARFILPECTKTTMLMTGNLRSWIHFLEIRDDKHAQLEVQIIAKEIKKQLLVFFSETFTIKEDETTSI